MAARKWYYDADAGQVEKPLTFPGIFYVVNWTQARGSYDGSQVQHGMLLCTAGEREFCFCAWPGGSI